MSFTSLFHEALPCGGMVVVFASSSTTQTVLQLLSVARVATVRVSSTSCHILTPWFAMVVFG
jgi:hypothetical protein